MRIIITGGRNRAAFDALADEIGYLEGSGEILSGTPVTIVHGGCPTGVDYDAGITAETHCFGVESHPADWDRYGRAAGPKRNEEMAALGADLCLAFPSAAGSPGTWDMIRKAVKHGIKTIIMPEES
jgi:hypothetical protein